MTGKVMPIKFKFKFSRSQALLIWSTHLFAAALAVVGVLLELGLFLFVQLQRFHQPLRLQTRRTSLNQRQRMHNEYHKAICQTSVTTKFKDGQILYHSPL